MSSINKIKSIKSFHRFGYLHPELVKIQGIGQTPIPKLMIMDCGTYNIVWDMRDGLGYPSDIQEDAKEHKQYVSKFPNKKKYVYVKINYSPTQCKIHHELADKNNGHIITCPSFSLYANTMNQIFNKREELRKKRKPMSDKIVFVGNPGSFGREKKNKEMKQKYGERFENAGKISVDQYINNILLSNKILYQPHGVGLRHSIYEGMALGIRSIIEPSTYLPHELEKVTMSSYNEEIETYFEENLTPKNILNSVFSQVDELLV